MADVCYLNVGPPHLLHAVTIHHLVDSLPKAPPKVRWHTFCIVLLQCRLFRLGYFGWLSFPSKCGTQENSTMDIESETNLIRGASRLCIRLLLFCLLLRNESSTLVTETESPLFVIRLAVEPTLNAPNEAHLRRVTQCSPFTVPETCHASIWSGRRPSHICRFTSASRHALRSKASLIFSTKTLLQSIAHDVLLGIIKCHQHASRIRKGHQREGRQFSKNCGRSSSKLVFLRASTSS